jgi:hypothetical protein
VLGVAPGASAGEVSRAWRSLAARHHPDVGGDPDWFRRLAAARDELGRRASRPVTVTVERRRGPVAAVLIVIRRRIDRRLHPRVR